MSQELNERTMLDIYLRNIYNPPAKVYCWTCGEHIYNLRRVSVTEELTLCSSLFKPASSRIPLPSGGAKCPVCGLRFLGPDGELLIENIASLEEAARIEEEKI